MIFNHINPAPSSFLKFTSCFYIWNFFQINVNNLKVKVVLSWESDAPLMKAFRLWVRSDWLWEEAGIRPSLLLHPLRMGWTTPSWWAEYLVTWKLWCGLQAKPRLHVSMNGCVPLVTHGWGEGRLDPSRITKEKQTMVSLWASIFHGGRSVPCATGLASSFHHWICSLAQSWHAWVKACQWYCWISSSQCGLYNNWLDRFWVCQLAMTIIDPKV